MSPPRLPTLIKAYRIQDKARGVGFDWEQPEDVWTKVDEELRELREAITSGSAEDSEAELGDFLFSVINVARKYGINPDNALERTNAKFIRRFGYVEAKAKEAGRSLRAYGPSLRWMLSGRGQVPGVSAIVRHLLRFSCLSGI